MAKTKAHQRYSLADGTGVPGVTTILGAVLSKPALIHWAWDCGMKGIDYRKVRDHAADIGTIAHALIECDIKSIEFDRSQYAPSDVDKAENSYLAWLEWKKNYSLETIQSECQLVSETHRFGGTLDWIVQNHEHIWLVDFKSSKDVYPEMRYQLAAYKELWNENNPHHLISQCHIVRLGKEDGAFNHYFYPDLEKEWQIFIHCLTIYNLQKEKK